MPIYEYECEQCGRIMEAFQKFSDAPLTECTNCSGNLHKLISQSSFHLKGSGWYVTDYANKSKKNTATDQQKTSKSADTSENKTKSDTKPDATKKTSG